MSSEIHKIRQNEIRKKQNFYNAEVISFPNDKNFFISKEPKVNSISHWKITDSSNKDQLKAIYGICLIFCSLIIMGIYSSLI